MSANLYLSAYLAPLAPWLSRPDVTDVLINRPGIAGIDAGQIHVERRVDGQRARFASDSGGEPRCGNQAC